jgi:hypothetical protein
MAIVCSIQPGLDQRGQPDGRLLLDSGGGIAHYSHSEQLDVLHGL